MAVSGASPARVRISLQTGDFEVEGSEAFVATFQTTLDALAEKVVAATPQPATPLAPTSSGAGAGSGAALSAEFPEALHGLPKGASGTDQILVAGHYASLATTDTTFATTDANKLLIEQGVKLSNASQSMKNNLTAKRVFKVGNRFRISKTGEEYLRTLVGR